MRVLRRATKNFSDVLGGGGFGTVYKGTLPDGREIAVKILASVSSQGEREFYNEIHMLAGVRHPNLVRLQGYCVTKGWKLLRLCFGGGQKLLVYEFMPNGSLDKFLKSRERRRELNWNMRYNIIIKGIAQGILHLHQRSPWPNQVIIHRDLKPANVLLDADMNPKVADFGLARITNFEKTHVTTSHVTGTFGYMAPELLQGQFSVKSDVYSFGVMVLEIVSGRKVHPSRNPFGEEVREGLITYARKCWEHGSIRQLIDATLGDSYLELEVNRCIQLGMLCIQHEPSNRPTMDSVVQWLNSNDALPMPAQAVPLNQTLQTLGRLEEIVNDNSEDDQMR